MESILKYKNIKIIYGICLRNRQKKFSSDNEIINKKRYRKEFDNNGLGELCGTYCPKRRSKSCFLFEYEKNIDWNKIHKKSICEFVTELFNECIEISEIRNQDIDYERTIFDIKKEINLKEYLERIVNLTEIDHNSIVTALVLIDEFLFRTMINLRKSNICMIILTAFYISIKMNEDNIFKSKYFCEIFGVTLKKLSELEIFFLSNIRFKCYIKPNVQNFYSSCISQFI